MRKDRLFSASLVLSILVFAGYSMTSSHLAVAQTTAPTASDQSVSTDEDVAIDINLTGTDPDMTDALIFSIQGGPSFGNLSALQAPLTHFSASLDGLQEVPPNNTTATGNGTFTYDHNTNLLSFDIQYSGLSSNETAAHIHNGTAGTAGPIFAALPSGTVKTGVVGPLTAPQQEGLFAGNWYVNIHSANFTDGEIRGQILPTGNAEAKVTYTPNPDFSGTDSFVYQVSDGNSTDNGTVTIEVRPIPDGNNPPVADAGVDQTVNENAAVSLNGTASSDSDGTIASYAWMQTAGLPVVLNNLNTATPSFTAPEVDANETLTFQLTVTDNAGGNATDSVNVSVLPTGGGANEGTFLLTMNGTANGVERVNGVMATDTTVSPLTVSVRVTGDWECGLKGHVKSVRETLEGGVMINGTAHEFDKVMIVSRSADLIVMARLDDGTEITAKLAFERGMVKCDEAKGLDMDSIGNWMRIEMDDSKFRIDPNTASGGIAFE